MARAALLAVGCASVVLITGLDHSLYQLLARNAPQWKVLPDIRIPSLFVTLVLCILFGRESLRAPLRSTPWARVAGVSLSWLSGCVVAVFLFRVWTPTLDSWVDSVSFLITGLLAEEFLFRGAVFTLASQAFATEKNNLMIAVLVSASLFGIQHFGYHGWHFGAASLTQVIYTTALGVLLGLFRSWSGSLWVPTALHIANNLITVSYRLLGN